jgi:hypothetical protein
MRRKHAWALAAAVAAVVAVFAHRMARWGALEAETRMHLPGDDVIPGSRPTVTNAVTIEAPPEAVWPWVVQIGRGRAGFYTYTWLENLIGADIHNLDHVDPALQSLRVGDRVWLTPERYLGRIPGQFYRVRRVETGRSLVLEQRPPENPTAGTWALVLQPAGEGRTRLLSRHCAPAPRGLRAALAAWFWSLSSVMERRMLLGIRERAHRA